MERKTVLHKQGDIFNTEADIICHQVNCQGVMGSGIAKTIREKYPEAYKAYNQYCASFKPEDLLGNVRWAKSESRYIANIFGQLNYGRDKNTVYTSYEALETGFKDVHDFAKKNRLTVAIPYGIGCGLANGDWNIVSTIIKDIFWDNVICEISRLEN